MLAVLDVPTATGPKARTVVLGVIWPGEVLIDSVAGLLLTLPAVLLTVTVKIVPSSVAAVAGVVYVGNVAPEMAFPFFSH